MSKIEKLILKFKSVPKDLTWEELIKILNYHGYIEKSNNSKTRGSRKIYISKDLNIISLHKPHPRNIVKQYVIRQLLEKLEL